jgi:hypothetical protein
MENRPDEKVIQRLQKLLALANNNPNEHEAASAMARANALLEEYNLDMAVLGQSGKGPQRSDTKKSGGLYGWQRKLWKAVAELNFCHYMSIKGLAKGSVYEHRLIGSHANVIATEMMANYLQATIEKLAQQWAKDNFFKSVFVREAIAYREGMTARISERLQARRREIVAEERRKTEEAKREQAVNGVQTTNALTILDVISTEADFNNDYLNGWDLGTTARNRVEQEARMAAYRREAEAREAAKTPEQKAREAAAMREQIEKWAREDAKAQKRRNKTPPKPRYRRETPEEARANLGSYWGGRAKGDDVGIDTQVDRKQDARRIA